jgi:hypothetical protein
MRDRLKRKLPVRRVVWSAVSGVLVSAALVAVGVVQSDPSFFHSSFYFPHHLQELDGTGIYRSDGPLYSLVETGPVGVFENLEDMSAFMLAADYSIWLFAKDIHPGVSIFEQPTWFQVEMSDWQDSGKEQWSFFAFGFPFRCSGYQVRDRWWGPGVNIHHGFVIWPPEDRVTSSRPGREFIIPTRVYWLAATGNVLFWTVAAFALKTVSVWARRTLRRRRGRCGECAYDLKGDLGGCPECGWGMPAEGAAVERV